MSLVNCFIPISSTNFYKFYTFWWDLLWSTHQKWLMIFGYQANNSTKICSEDMEWSAPNEQELHANISQSFKEKWVDVRSQQWQKTEFVQL